MIYIYQRRSMSYSKYLWLVQSISTSDNQCNKLDIKNENEKSAITFYALQTQQEKFQF